MRNAFRIALETNRTLILPQLRLGTYTDWAPFLTLAKQYESQDKDALRTICKEGKTADWRLEYQPCRDVNKWIEMAWSDFFDLDAVRDQFNIRIYERRVSHGWGIRDSLISQLNLAQEDVVVVDPTSFPSNGSDWENLEQLKQKVQNGNNLMDRFFAPAAAAANGLTVEERESLKLTTALKNIVTAEHLMQLDQRYIQFGSLVYGLRFQTSISKQQSALQKALRSNVFVSPNQFRPINGVAQEIVKTLGDNYSVIHMDFKKLAMIELVNQRAMKKEKAEIEGTKYTDNIQTAHKNGIPFTSKELIDQIDPDTQSELMSALIRELHGDMPINQALSAAMPLHDDSLLKDLLDKSDSIKSSRRSLLTACIQYRKEEDQKYPIYYLTNDVYDDIVAHPELFKPLMDSFPCTFTKNDMYEWGVIRSNWAKQIDSLNEPNVDYEHILSEILEILVARKGKFFFFWVHKIYINNNM